MKYNSDHPDDGAAATITAADDCCGGGKVSSMLALLRAARNIQDQLEATLDLVDLSPAKYQALEALVVAGGSLPLSELAGKLRCVRSNITQLADRLESDGLVRRVDDPGDRRAVLAVVTPLGIERQSAGESAIGRLQESLAARVSPDDRESFFRVLSALQ
ncbi:MAG: MarR family transcriptional regulator [bacterium]